MVSCAVSSSGVCGRPDWQSRPASRPPTRQVRRQAHRHHLLRHGHAQPDAGVEAARHQVDRAIVERNIERDVGAELPEAHGQRLDQQCAQRARHGKAQGAGWPALRSVQRRERIVDLFDGRAQAGVQGRAGFGQGHVARGALEQHHVVAPLEQLDRLADGGGGDVQARGSRREAFQFGDRQEGFESVKGSIGHGPIMNL